MSEGVPSVEELDRMSTDDLRERAFAKAESRHDVGFFWDLVRHLPAAEEIAAEDGSSGALAGGIQETVEVVRGLLGGDYGDAEPLIRARFIDYLRAS